VASDASLAQLARARRHPRVRYRAATGEAAALPAAAADLVTVAQAVHWFDPSRFWPEVRRVLAAGGAVAVWTYDLARVDPAVDAVVERYYRLLGPYWPPERALVEGAYRDLRFPFDEVASPAFEMRAAWDLARLAGYLATWSAARQWSAAHGGAAALDEVAGDLAAAWGAPQRRRTVTWPLTVRAGRP
jgi:SAM-dependent methyltransferase